MDRAHELARLAAGAAPFDLVVIGGGANGAGCALDGASRGLRVLLLERGDFGSGTSSRSSKLVHGGLRYLAQGRLGLVREALRERALLLANAPELVRPRTFVVPLESALDSLKFGAGVALYDWLAGTHGLARGGRLDRAALACRVPGLRRHGLRGAVTYGDAQFDDARLLLALVRAAHAHGAAVLNYVEAVAFEYDARGRIRGVVARDSLDGHEYAIAARGVINAAGVWGDRIRAFERPLGTAQVLPSQGAHVVVAGHFLDSADAVVLPHTADGRIMFALPWHGSVLLGTTDTALAHLPEQAQPLATEVDEILAVAGRYLAQAPTRADVRAAFAGVRPLAAHAASGSTARVSREHQIEISRGGLVSVSGGKWTTYRLVAEQCVDALVSHAGLSCGTSRTRAIELREAAGDGVAALVADRPELGTPLHPALPYCGADYVWAVQAEMTLTVADALAYRTRALFIDAHAAAAIAPKVAALMGACAGWDDARIAAEQAAAAAIAARYCLTPTRVPDRPG